MLRHAYRPNSTPDSIGHGVDNVVIDRNEIPTKPVMSMLRELGDGLLRLPGVVVADALS